MTDRAFVSGRSTSITFGHMTSFIINVQSRVSGDQSEEKAQLDRCDRCPDGFIHCSRCVNRHSLRPWSGVYRWSQQAMDQGRGRGDFVYRARVTLGERLLRELQRPFQGRTLEWGGVFCSQIDDQIVTTAYETKRPHSAIRYRQPAPESVTPMDEKRMMLEISNRTKPWGYLNIYQYIQWIMIIFELKYIILKY